MMRQVAIGLGANLAWRDRPPIATLGAALVALNAAPMTRVLAVSSAYRTRPVGPPQPPYVNTAAMLWTALPLPTLLAALVTIERRFGRRRERERRWGPRTLDLDILVDGRTRIDAAGLVVPHPRLGERAFVLVPLAEIAPDLRVPGIEVTVSALARRLPAIDRSDVARIGRL